MIHIIWSLIVGLFIGIIAKVLAPHLPFLHIQSEHIGLLMTALLGVAGSFVGGLIAQVISRPAPGAKFHPAGCLMSILGAIIVLWAYSHFNY